MVLPENAGEITSVCFDFNDDWSYPVANEKMFPVEGKLNHMEKDGIHGAFAETTHYFNDPGTYFASVRISSQRNGDADDIFTQVKNLDRVRIIVK